VTDLSGFDPNVEAVLGFEPDLVVIANDANDLVAGLTAAGVPVLISTAPVDIESGYPLIADLGVAVGRVDETAEVIATMRDEMAAAFAAAPDAEVRIYHELDDTYFSASSFGFIGSVYAELGATNIADAGDPDGTGFPQLTEEAIVEADPEIIVITDEIGYTADDVAARPGWGDITAVDNGAIVSVDADIASRWGPRLPQFVTAVAAAMAAVAVPAG
jgi:iron complex transport system substrate-binding protein